MKSALVIGHNGQDGKIISSLLSENGLRVVGVDKNNLDIRDKVSVEKLINELKPDQLYYLAAFHGSTEDTSNLKHLDDVSGYFEINLMAYVNFLNAIKRFSPHTKVFYACSSHIFAGSSSETQNESTPPAPNSPYGFSKLAALQVSEYFRNKYGVFIAVGILYNHESKYRKASYLSSKIITTLLKSRTSSRITLELLNTSDRVDWGHAEDYMKAAIMMLNHHSPETCVIASHETHTIEEFITLSAQACQIPRENIIVKTASHQQILKKPILCGDTSKIKKLLNWTPTYSFEKMIPQLVKEYLESSN